MTPVATVQLPIETIDGFWAEVIGCEPDAFRSGGNLQYLPRDEYDVQVFLTPDGGVIAVPARLLERLDDPTFDQVLEPAWWAGVLNVQLSRLACHGPAALLYATEETFSPEPHPFVRQLRRRDADELARFARILHAREPETFHYWSIGGREVGQVRLWGAYVEGRIVAVAGERAWSPNIREIGLNVLPKWRGEGYGTSLASEATADILDSVPLVQWSSPTDEPAALHIAQNLGYRPYAHHLWFTL